MSFLVIYLLLAGADIIVVWIAVYHVGPDGWTKLSGDDVGELHYKYHPILKAPVEQEMTDADASTA